MSDCPEPILSKMPGRKISAQTAGEHGESRFQGGPHIELQPRHTDTSPAESQAPDTSSEQYAQAWGDRQLVAVNLKKGYQMGGAHIPVLGGLNLDVGRGEFLAIVGQSGSGKSTLLHLLGTLDGPDDGEIYFEGQRVDNLPSVQRDIIRNKYVGMIFQFYHLLPELNALENVLVPLMIAQSGWNYFRQRRKHHQTAKQLLELVGLTHRLKHKPRELSGGEMQRAAIARALIAGPRLLLADEPTGNLDHATGREILDILRRLNRQQNLTIVMVTHDQAIAEQADRIVRLADGRVDDR